MSVQLLACCCLGACCTDGVGRLCRLPGTTGAVADLDVSGFMRLVSRVSGVGTVERAADWTAAPLSQTASACVLVETPDTAQVETSGSAIDEAWSMFLRLRSDYTQPATAGGTGRWRVRIDGEILRNVSGGGTEWAGRVNIIVRVDIAAGQRPCVVIEAAQVSLDPVGPCIVCAPFKATLPLEVSLVARDGGECPTTLRITCPQTGVFQTDGTDEGYWGFGCSLELTQPTSVIRDCSGAGHDLLAECTGACCKDGSCSTKTATQCAADGGFWRGSGVACSEVACNGSIAPPPSCIFGPTACVYNQGSVTVEFDLLVELTISCCVSGSVVNNTYTRAIVDSVLITLPGPDCSDITATLPPINWPAVLSCAGTSLGIVIAVDALFSCGNLPGPGGARVPITELLVDVGLPLAVYARSQSANYLDIDASQEYLSARCPSGTGPDYPTATLRVTGSVRAVGRSSRI